MNIAYIKLKEFRDMTFQIWAKAQPVLDGTGDLGE